MVWLSVVFVLGSWDFLFEVYSEGTDLEGSESQELISIALTLSSNVDLLIGCPPVQSPDIFILLLGNAIGITLSNINKLEVKPQSFNHKPPLFSILVILHHHKLLIFCKIHQPQNNFIFIEMKNCVFQIFIFKFMELFVYISFVDCGET